METKQIRDSVFIGRFPNETRDNEKVKQTKRFPGVTAAEESCHMPVDTSVSSQLSLGVCVCVCVCVCVDDTESSYSYSTCPI